MSEVMDQVQSGTRSDARGERRWLALLVVALLVGQSLLCAAHCSFSSPATVEHGAVAYGFYCPIGAHHHHNPDTKHAPIPAYWPGVLVPLVLLLGLLLFARLAPPRSPALHALRWTPPVPPPR